MIEEKAEQFGYRLVELNINHKYKTVTIIIYKKEGIGTKDCANLSNELMDDIEYIEQYGRDYNLEISSPGTSRRFKSYKEYNIFSGKEVKIISITDNGNTETTTGILQGIDENNNILLENEYKLLKIPYSSIKRSNLVFH